jgi:methyltransferase (TIGR00027 family)
MDAAPSQTAMIVAVGRGRHRWEGPPPWVFDDPFALVLVGPSWREMAARAARLPDAVARQLRANLVVRARYAEDRLTRGMFGQYVILGAGPDLLRGLRVYEVDHPASQVWKRQRAAELGLPISERHVFATVDFEAESLGEGLDRAGFDWTQRSMFSWLGVIEYLTIDAIEATLRTIGACRSDSEVAFSYPLKDEFLHDVGRESREMIAPLLAGMGEPYQTRWSPDDAEAVTARCGLRVADHQPSGGALIAHYYGDRSNGLRRLSIGLAAAMVP